jgi:hypothetical protein
MYLRKFARPEQLQTDLSKLESPDAVQREIRNQIARLQSTEDSVAITAGSVLQVGKQVLAFRFGAKPLVTGARVIGSQSIVEVIWQGRNHALHWEELNPHAPVTQMLTKLQSELGTNIRPSANNAYQIVAALGWFRTEDVMDDLQRLIG